MRDASLRVGGLMRSSRHLQRTPQHSICTIQACGVEDSLAAQRNFKGLLKMRYARYKPAGWRATAGSERMSACSKRRSACLADGGPSLAPGSRVGRPLASFYQPSSFRGRGSFFHQGSWRCQAGRHQLPQLCQCCRNALSCLGLYKTAVSWPMLSNM